MPARALLLALLALVAGCQQARHPDTAAATQAAAGGGGAGSGGAAGAGALVATRIAVDGAALSARFPGLARLAVTAAPAGASPVQADVPLSGGGATLALPAGAPTRFTFDGFDASGRWIAHGRGNATIANGTVVPVRLQPPPAGTPYTDPLTGLSTTGPTHALTVEVVDEATHAPVSGAVVVAGQAALPVDARGRVVFAALPAGAAVHAFAPDGRAASVIGAAGRVRLPLPLVGRALAVVDVNPPAGPGVNASTLADVYLTDGDRIAASGHAQGDAAARFVFPALAPMAAPIGVTAMIENPRDATPRPDRGLLATVSASPHTPAAPLTMQVGDPYARPRHAGLAWHLVLPAPPAGLPAIRLLDADVFAVGPGGVWQLASHKGGEITPPGERWTTAWELGAPAYAARVRASDGYAEVEARVRLPAPLPPPAQWPPFAFPQAHPVVQQATAASIRWADTPQPGNWDGFVVEIAQQGLVRWRIFGLAPPTGALALPAAPAQVQAPLKAGVPAEARVEAFVWDAAVGPVSAQDLEHWSATRRSGRARPRSRSCPEARNWCALVDSNHRPTD